MHPVLTRLGVELNRTCNLKCIQCLHFGPLYQGQADHHPLEMTLDQFRMIVDQFSSLHDGTKYCYPHFQGEPLLFSHFLEACEYLEMKKIYFSFTTNGMLLSRDVARSLMTMKYLNMIAFSIDGITKDTMEKIRRGVNYERVVGNVLSFMDERYDHHRKDILVTVNFVEMEENKSEVERFVDYWVDKVDQVSISTVTDTNGRPVNMRWRPKREPCRALENFLVVLTNGDVVPCCRDHQYEMVMGNVFEKSLKEVWEGDLYKFYRDIHDTHQWNEGLLCGDCDTWMCELIDIEFKIRYDPAGITQRRGPFWSVYFRNVNPNQW